MHKSKIFLFFLIFVVLFSSITYPFQLGFNIYSSDLSSIENVDSASSNNKLTNIQSSQKLQMSADQIKQIIGLQKLLDQGFTGKNVRIGFVDTGIKANAVTSNGISVFGNRVIAEKSFVTTANNYGGNDLSIIDTEGHGTTVASIAAGSEFGMAPAATLVAGKIYSSGINGNAGYPGEETTRGVVKAILYCASQNATIISLSLGQYSNIVNDGRQYIIDKLSKENNIIFTISAANEGSSGLDGGSIGTPGTAFQAITVAASNGGSSMAYFSSSGIRNDYTVKPDVTAPGVNIPVNTINNQDSYEDGTSFSAPIVAGGIAVLIDALARSGRSYTVGAIKAALLETASPIGTNPIWYQGAGMVNFTAAYQLLMNKPLTHNIPTIATAFPKKLPISPLNTVFNGQTIPFNLTVVSSISDSATISLHGIPDDTMSFNNNQTFNNSERLSLLFHPTINTSQGSYDGYLLLSFDSGQKITIEIQFIVKKPLIKILFDETRNGFVNIKRPGESASKLDDPWGDTAFLLGQYRNFYNLMSVNNISVTPFFKGTYTNLSYLNQFDTVLFPYPNSKLTNLFTDWYNDPLYDGNFKLTKPTLSFSKTELNTLNTYIQNVTKGLLILTSDQIDTNVTAFNSMLNSLGIGYTLSNPSTTLQESLKVVSTDQIFNNVSYLDYYGTNFTSLNTTPNVESFENNTFLQFDGHANNNQTKGRIIVSGSGYFAENYMLTTFNSNYKNDCKFVLNLLTWLKGFDSMNISCNQKPTDQQFVTSIKINPEPNYSQTTINLLIDLIPFLLMIPLVLILIKRRKKIQKD